MNELLETLAKYNCQVEKIDDGSIIITLQVEKWQPEEDELYFYPGFDSESGKFVALKDEWIDTKLDKGRLKNWHVFKNIEECQEYCKGLNQLLKM